MKNKKHLSLRIDPELLEKFHYVCEYNARSANGQLNIYIKKLVENFEQEHGEININKCKNKESNEIS